jgi:dipeptidyl-peptidase-4
LTKRYWGSEVPEGWTGGYSDKLKTIPEKTGFKKTASHYETLEFISTLAWNSEYIHIERMFVSKLRRVCPLVILSNPRVTTPQEAKASGKPIVYLQGNIHPPESEGKEAALMVMRDGTPHIQSMRHNATDADINRDGINMKTINMKGLYENVLIKWDPHITLDLHSMGRVQHGYSLLYAPSYTPTAHPGPRGYTQYTVLPWIRDHAEIKFGCMFYTHADFDWDDWPPKVWDPVKGGYSVEAKFIVNAIGLRNRLSILTETPGHVGFEKRIYASYSFALSLLDYVVEYGDEVINVCRDADEDVVKKVLEKAESGKLMNWVAGEYSEQDEKCELYAFETRKEEYIPGTSVVQHILGEGKPPLVKGVTDLTKPIGTKKSIVPRGYVFYGELIEIAEKLKAHGVEVTQINEPMILEGYEFIVDEFRETQKGWIRMFDMTELEGGWFMTRKTYPAGSYHVDMAQPLANVAFYCLEPEVGDGLVGWNYFNGYLKSRGADKNSVVFPVFKYLKVC